MPMDREEMEPTALPLHCMRVSQQCWLTTKNDGGNISLLRHFEQRREKKKMSLAAESRRRDNLAKHLSEQRRLVSACARASGSTHMKRGKEIT